MSVSTGPQERSVCPRFVRSEARAWKSFSKSGLKFSRSAFIGPREGKIISPRSVLSRGAAGLEKFFPISTEVFGMAQNHEHEATLRKTRNMAAAGPRSWCVAAVVAGRDGSLVFGALDLGQAIGNRDDEAGVRRSLPLAARRLAETGRAAPEKPVACEQCGAPRALSDKAEGQRAEMQRGLPVPQGAGAAVLDPPGATEPFVKCHPCQGRVRGAEPGRHHAASDCSDPRKASR